MRCDRCLRWKWMILGEVMMNGTMKENSPRDTLRRISSTHSTDWVGPGLRKRFRTKSAVPDEQHTTVSQISKTKDELTRAKSAGRSYGR